MMIELRIQRIGDNLWEMNKMNLKDVPAVYFIYGANKELLYIGQTQRLLTRTIEHFRQERWFKLYAKYISFRDVVIDDLRREESAIENYEPEPDERDEP